jgi:hypothetical protein
MQQTLPLLFSELGEDEFIKLTENAEIIQKDKVKYIKLQDEIF